MTTVPGSAAEFRPSGFPAVPAVTSFAPVTLLGASTLNTRTVLGGALILLASLLAALQFRRPGAAGTH